MDSGYLRLTENIWGTNALKGETERQYAEVNKDRGLLSG